MNKTHKIFNPSEKVERAECATMQEGKSELYWIACWGARSLVDLPSHSRAHGKDGIYAKRFP